MRILPQDQPDLTSLISRYFADKQFTVAEVWTFENFQSELDLLNEAESILPSGLFFDLHFDLIVNKGREAVTEYHRNLIKGKNLILEKVRPHLLTSDAKKLDEAIDQFLNERRKRTEKILIESQEGIDPLVKVQAGVADSILQEQGSSENSDSSVLSIAKSIWNSITEDGSAIGVLQLVLDLLGLFGDFVFPGGGTAFDLVNALIYLVRGMTPGAPEGMYTLALISAISAIPGIGDVAKVFKYGKFGKAAIKSEAVLRASFRGGDEAARAAIQAIPLDQRSGVMKFLSLIAKYGTQISSWFVTGIGFISKWVVGKISSLIPFVGTRVSKFFDDMGKQVMDWGKKLNNFSQSFDGLKSSALKAELKRADDVLKQYRTQSKGRFEYVKATDSIKLFDNKKKLIGEFPATLVERSKLWQAGFPKLFPSDAQAKQAAAAWETFLSRSGKRFVDDGSRRYGKIITSPIKKFAFLGKQVFKILNDLNKSKDSDLSEEITSTEDEVMGLQTFDNLKNEMFDEKQKETGAKYVPYVTFDAYDQEAIEAVDGLTNATAQTIGERSIGRVVYNRFKNDEQMKDIRDFFEDARSGKIIELPDGTWVPNPDYKAPETEIESTESDEKEAMPIEEPKRKKFDVERAKRSVQEGALKHISPYSRFN